MSQLLWQRKDSNDTPFRAAFSQSLPKRVSNCVKAVGGVEVGESYAVCSILRGSALFIGRGLRVAVYFLQFILIWAYLQGFRVLTIDGIGLTIDEKRPFFYYPTFRTPSLPWLVVGLGFLVADVTPPGPFFMGEHSGPLLRDPVPGSGIISKNGPFFITYTLGSFVLLLVFLGGLGVVGPSTFLYSFLPSSSLPKIQAIKKGPVWGPSCLGGVAV